MSARYRTKKGITAPVIKPRDTTLTSKHALFFSRMDLSLPSQNYKMLNKMQEREDETLGMELSSALQSYFYWTLP